MKTIERRIIGVGLSILLVYFLLYFAYWHDQRATLASPPSSGFRNGLNSVAIKMVPRDGRIFVKASFDGIDRLCILDTGSPTTHLPETSIPATSVIAATLFHSRAEPYPGGVARPILTKTVKLIRIGDYEITHVPVRDYKFSPQDSKVGEVIPILGSDLFKNMRLTIDYATSTVTIDRPQTQSKPVGHDLSFNFDAPSRHYGLILLTGAIADHPGPLLFDTGQGLGPLNVTDKDIARSMLDPEDAQEADRPQAILRANWRIENVNFRSPAFTSPLVSGPFIGVIGIPVCYRYRVTIDYLHNTISFHRYGANECPPHLRRLQEIFFND